AHQADATLHEVANRRKTLLLDERMAGPAVGVGEDAGRVGEGAVVVGPAVAVGDDLQGLDLLEALVDDPDAGVELVGAGAVAGAAGQEDELLLFRLLVVGDGGGGGEGWQRGDRRGGGRGEETAA